MDKTKAYRLLKDNQKKYKNYFYRTAQDLGISAAELSALFTNKGRRANASVSATAFKFEVNAQHKSFIDLGESQD